MFQATSPENAAIIGRLEGALSELPMGQTIEYGRLNTVAKCDVQSKSRWLLHCAIEHAEKSLGCAFSCVRMVGIRRLTSEETPDVGLAAIRKVRMTARRGKKRIDRANTNSLTDFDKRRIIGYGAMLGAIHMIADGRRAIAIAAVADPVKPIPPENILDMFRSVHAA